MTLQTDELIVVSTAVSSAIFAGSVVWFVAGQFSKNRNQFWQSIAALQRSIEMKIDDHEKLDQARFETLQKRLQRTNNRIWRIQVRNAVRDGTAIDHADEPNNGDG